MDTRGLFRDPYHAVRKRRHEEDVYGREGPQMTEERGRHDDD